MDFYELDLHDKVFDALDAMGFQDCTPVQEQTIPVILEGHDVIGVAQTGTGKTAAFLLPVLSKLCSGKYPQNAVNCLIMSPTRELAQQIDQALEGFSYFMNVSSVAIYGGNDGIRYANEKRSLERGADVIIATPGRLISHASLGNVDFSKVSFFILDEADRMLDMGFSDDIMQIEKLLPKSRQTILFSATMPDKIVDLARKIMNKPVEIKLAVSKPAEKIKQNCYLCAETQKVRIIQDIFKHETPEKVIIFSSSKLKVKELTRVLLRSKFNVGEMHSDLAQKERDQMMYRFKTSEVDILVATDIISRGIDIDDIRLVINYDVPHDAEDYVHRIGRSARAGRDGAAITLVSGRDRSKWATIEHFLEKTIDRLPLPEGMEEIEEEIESKRPNKHSQKNNQGTNRRGSSGNPRLHTSKNTSTAPQQNKSSTSEQQKRKHRSKRSKHHTPNSEGVRAQATTE